MRATPVHLTENLLFYADNMSDTGNSLSLVLVGLMDCYWVLYIRIMMIGDIEDWCRLSLRINSIFR